MIYNSILEHEVISDLSDEPVALDDLKRHLNMLFDTAGSHEFNDDDIYLSGLLKAARRALENYTGISFGLKTIVAYLDNSRGSIEIPYGPFRSIEYMKNVNAELIESDDYTLRGSRFKKIISPSYDYIEVKYTAGLEELPEDLKHSILTMAAALYKYRGDHSEAEAGRWYMMALELASPYKRTSMLV